MKKHRFIAMFRTNSPEPGYVVHESTARVHGKFGTFLATQQHDPAARRAFIADLSGHPVRNPKACLSRFKAISSLSINP